MGAVPDHRSRRLEEASMRKSWGWAPSGTALLMLAGFIALPVSAQAAPTVKTVPWVANDPSQPHDTYAGKLVRLKGTSDVQGAGVTYDWDFGDGSPHSTGPVTNMFVIEATHTYVGAVNTLWTAVLTVTDPSGSSSQN